MGSTKQDKQALREEGDQFECGLILEPYKISRYPITVSQYREFVRDGGYKMEHCWTNEGWEWFQSKLYEGPEIYGDVFEVANHPQVGISWYYPADGRENSHVGNETYRIIRGGDFNQDYVMRCAMRSCAAPHIRSNNIGFRVVSQH